LLLCSIPIAAALGALRLEQLYVVALGVGAMTLLFDVAYQSYLPGLVRRERLVEANSRLELSRSVATTIGPGSTGVLVHLFSAPGAVALDALSFVASAISLRWIQAPESVPEARATRTSIDFLAGVRWVAANPLLRPLAATALLISFFDSALIGVLVLYALRELGLTPLGLGLILTAASAGDIAGALLARPIAARLGVGPAVIGGAVVIGLGGALFPLAGGPALLAAAVLAVAELLFRLGALVYSVNQLSLRQAITPDALLGRVNATMRVLIQGVAPVGAVAGGIFAEWLGLRATLIAVAVGLLIAAPLLWASRVRLARDANTEMLAASQ